MLLYLYILISLFFFYLSGHILIFLCKIKESSNTYFNVFAKLFTGLVSFITLYSIVKTGGKTINLGFVFIGAASLYLLQKGNFHLKSNYNFNQLFKFNFKKNILPIIELLIIALAWYIFQCCSYEKVTYYLNNDEAIFYSKVAEYLNLTGVENMNNMYSIFGVYKDTSPYHYFEIWLCAGLAYFFNILAYVAYLKVMIPVLLTILSAGLIALFKSFFKSNYFNLIVPLLVFCHTIILPFFPADVATFDQFPTSCPKTLPLYIAIIFFVLLFKKNLPLSLIILSSAALITISASIGIFGGIFLLLLYLFIWKKTLIKREFYFILFYMLFLSAFIYFFYLITGMKEKNVYNVISVRYIIQHIQISLHIFIKTLLELLCLYCAYILIAAYFFRRWNKMPDVSFLLKITGFIILAALSAWAILFEMADAVQLFAIPAIPFITVLLIYLLIVILYKIQNNPKKLIILTCIISIIIGKSIFDKYQWESYLTQKTYTTKYINSINLLITEKPINPTGICLKGGNDYNTFFYKNPIYTLGYYLKTLKPNFNTVSISVFDTPIDSTEPIAKEREHQFIAASVFYKFVSTQKESGAFKTVPLSQIDFIRKFHIQYGIISKNAKLSDTLNAIIAQSITDSISGEKFVVFK